MKVLYAETRTSHRALAGRFSVRRRVTVAHARNVGFDWREIWLHATYYAIIHESTVWAQIPTVHWSVTSVGHLMCVWLLPFVCTPYLVRSR